MQAEATFNTCLHAEPLHYAELAPISRGYSPLRGRFLTCYAPVRHATRDSSRSWSPVRVRLACVRHAANVRPEPGSNSPIRRIRSDSTRSVRLPDPARAESCTVCFGPQSCRAKQCTRRGPSRLFRQARFGCQRAGSRFEGIIKIRDHGRGVNGTVAPAAMIA